MTEVQISKQIKVEAVKAWGNLSSFRGIEKISPIEKSETVGQGQGAKRTCYMPDGAEIHEVLSKVDNAVMVMQYKITEGPFPIEGYLSTIKVEATGEDSCKITWGCEFESAPEAKQDMINLFEGFYNGIIENLETLIVSQN